VAAAADGQSLSSTPTRMLIVDDDAGIAALVDEIFTDEGYAVTTMRDRDLESVRAAVVRLRPDCVLLDGGGRGDYGDSWTDAAWMTEQIHAVPVIMFSADRLATDEAASNASVRSQAAGFAAVVQKPFDLDELIRLVALAVTHSPFR
jgi:DNA-binding response OmpR family regulator